MALAGLYYGCRWGFRASLRTVLMMTGIGLTGLWLLLAFVSVKRLDAGLLLFLVAAGGNLLLSVLMLVALFRGALSNRKLVILVNAFAFAPVPLFLFMEPISRYTPFLLQFLLFIPAAISFILSCLPESMFPESGL